jgi:hypothetical protein
MTSQADELESLIQDSLAALSDASEGGPARPETNMRERFFEMTVLILGNLYTKTPVAAPLFDRTTLLRITTGMDDNEAGKLAGRGEDWLRLEGFLRQQDGQKAYFLTRPSLAVLSTLTSAGPLGEVFATILARYIQSMPTEDIRRTTRMLASYFITRMARS